MKFASLSLHLMVAATLAVDIPRTTKRSASLAQSGFDYDLETCDFSRIMVRTINDIKIIMDSPEWNECKEKSSMEGKEFQFPELVWFQPTGDIPCPPKPKPKPKSTANANLPGDSKTDKDQKMLGDSGNISTQIEPRASLESHQDFESGNDDQARASSGKSSTTVVDSVQTDDVTKSSKDLPSESCDAEVRELPQTVEEYIGSIKEVVSGCTFDNEINLSCYVPMKRSITRILGRYNPQNLSPETVDQIADHINGLIEETSKMDSQAVEWCIRNNDANADCDLFSRDEFSENIMRLRSDIENLRASSGDIPKYARNANLKTYQAKWRALQRMRGALEHFGRSPEESAEKLKEIRVLFETVGNEIDKEFEKRWNY